jgi:hypothetical protein
MTYNTTTHRLLALTEAARGALMANDLRRAEAAVTGMRHVLERHPDVAERDSWVTLHHHLEDSLESARAS